MTHDKAQPAASPAATLVGLGAIALWSVLALLTASAGAIPPFELAALTFAVGGGLGLVYAAARGRLAALIQPWPVWAVGVGGLFGYHALYFAALNRAPPAEASLIAYLWPLLIVLFSALLPGERLRARHLVGAALGFAGAATLFAGKAGGFSFAAIDPRVLSGYALALACAFVWSSYSVLSRRLKAAPTEAVAGFCLATAALAAICHYAFETDRRAGGRGAMGGDRRPRARPGRPRLLRLGLRRQARRHSPARRRRLRRAGALDADPRRRRLRPGDAVARPRLRADRRRRGRGDTAIAAYGHFTRIRSERPSPRRSVSSPAQRTQARP